MSIPRYRDAYWRILLVEFHIDALTCWRKTDNVLKKPSAI